MNCYFNLAKLISEKSDLHHKIGCVIVKKKRILSIGFNRRRTHPMQTFFSDKVHSVDEKTWDTRVYRYIHAEIDAISSLIKMKSIISDKHKLKNASIYIYRQTKDGKPALARPCVVCYFAIKYFGICNIYYTTNDGFAKETINYN